MALLELEEILIFFVLFDFFSGTDSFSNVDLNLLSNNIFLEFKSSESRLTSDASVLTS